MQRINFEHIDYSKLSFVCRNTSVISSSSPRRSVCKLRISCHDLAIERGRYKGLSVEERVCGRNKKNIDDEIHFLIDCPQYNSLRQKLFMFISENNKNYAALSSENKFIWLLSNEDAVICQKLALFIHKCFEVRSDSN
jgi:hypothetical protein